MFNFAFWYIAVHICLSSIYSNLIRMLIFVFPPKTSKLWHVQKTETQTASKQDMFGSSSPTFSAQSTGDCARRSREKAGWVGKLGTDKASPSLGLGEVEGRSCGWCWAATLVRGWGVDTHFCPGTPVWRGSRRILQPFLGPAIAACTHVHFSQYPYPAESDQIKFENSHPKRF